MADIRWKASDKKKLQKAVNNFNAKLRRLSKREDMQGVALPAPVKMRDLKNAIGTRKELNRELRSLHAFTKKGSEKPYTNPQGVKMTSWEVRDNKQRNRWINRELEKQRERVGNLEVTSRGIPQNLQRKEMGSVRMNELNDRKERSDTVRSASEWKLHREATLEKSHTDRYQNAALQRWKDNYIRALRNAGYSKIVPLVEKKTLKEFEKIMYSEQEAEVGFVYPDGVEEETKAEILAQIWS